MSIQNAVTQVVEELIAQVAIDRKFRAKVLKLTKKKLNCHVKAREELMKIAEDAISECTVKWLSVLKKGRLTLFLGAPVQDEGLVRQVVEKYLYRSSSNYLSTRLRRWSHGNERGQPGARARLIIDHDVEGSETQFWDSHVTPHRLIEEAIDIEQVETRLRALKVSEEHISYVRAHLNGDTYVEMANSPDVQKHDKYRKAVNRALVKLRVDMNR